MLGFLGVDDSQVTRFSSFPDLVLRSAIPKEKQETKKTAGEYSSFQHLKDSSWKEVYGLQVIPCGQHPIAGPPWKTQLVKAGPLCRLPLVSCSLTHEDRAQDLLLHLRLWGAGL